MQVLYFGYCDYIYIPKDKIKRFYLNIICMKKTIMIFTMLAFVAVAFSSCMASHKSSGSCPSHDPNYFRKN